MEETLILFSARRRLFPQSHPPGWFNDSPLLPQCSSILQASILLELSLPNKLKAAAHGRQSFLMLGKSGKSPDSASHLPGVVPIAHQLPRFPAAASLYLATKTPGFISTFLDDIHGITIRLTVCALSDPIPGRHLERWPGRGIWPSYRSYMV